MSALLAISVVSTLSAGQIWHHQGQPAQVIELFTSEGCSSCPPADKYLAKFKTDESLWRDIIPLAYHVDYWNYLGWKDEFARAEFSQLQRLYNAYGLTEGVYTPGFVVDSKEWRGFFNWFNQKLPVNNQANAERLTLKRNGARFELDYPTLDSLDATIVFLANEKKTVVQAGENKGKTLRHEFVVLERQSSRANNGKWLFDLSLDIEEVDAIAAWVSHPGKFERIQTVAGTIE